MLKIYECWTIMDENGHSEKDLTLEIWGGSTKHPDCKFYFQILQNPLGLMKSIRFFSGC